MRRQFAVSGQSVYVTSLTCQRAARAQRCRPIFVVACRMFREPASRLKLTPLWDGLAEASAVAATGKVPMYPGGWSAHVVAASTGRLVCVRALLAQFRGFSPESARLVLTGGGVRTPGCQKNDVRGAHGDSVRVGGETFGRKDFSPPCFARVSRKPANFQTFRAPFSRHCFTFQAPLTLYKSQHLLTFDLISQLLS